MINPLRRWTWRTSAGLTAGSALVLGFDDVNGNGYIAFTTWGHGNHRFLEEFDPAFLHLGKAVGADQADGE